MGCLKYLLRKEFTQLRRNAFLPRLILLFPVVVMLVVPLVANMDVKGVQVAWVDADASSLSQRMGARLEASPYFKLRRSAAYRDARALLADGKADVIVSVPAHFEALLQEGRPVPVQVEANAVNATKASLGAQYVVQTLASALREQLVESGPGAAASVREVSARFFYNPTQDYRFYMIPAFLIIIVMLICCFIPALNLVTEKEKGTLEQINVTPVPPLLFTLGKLIPYWLAGVLVLTEGILTVGWVYGLWPAGSTGTIYLAALLFALAMSGFAVLIANRSDTMQQCVFVLFFFVMVFMLMSGLLTPLASMPGWARGVTVLFPPRHFVEILRAVYLKGTPLAELMRPFLSLAGLAVGFCAGAALSYRKQA